MAGWIPKPGDEESGLPVPSGRKEEAPKEDAPQERPPEPPAAQDTGENCAIAGPSWAGKSCLIQAMHQACLQNTRNEPSLRFIPHGETAKLIQDAMERLFYHSAQHDLGTSEPPPDYPFEIRIKGKADGFHYRLADGPGSSLFPSREFRMNPKKDPYKYRERMIARAANATNLILCVDLEKPESEAFYSQLPLFFNDIRKQRGGPVPFRKVLVLLTKLDSYASQYIERAKREYQRNPGNRSLYATQLKTAFEFARSLHGPAMAGEAVGGEVLQMIWDNLDMRDSGDEVKMAVGLTSAYGFDAESGDRFWDPGKRAPSRDFSQADQARFRKWSPYGVRQALFFLATGEAFSPVVELTAGHLHRNYLAGAIKIPTS